MIYYYTGGVVWITRYVYSGNMSSGFRPTSTKFLGLRGGRVA